LQGATGRASKVAPSVSAHWASPRRFLDKLGPFPGNTGSLFPQARRGGKQFYFRVGPRCLRMPAAEAHWDHPLRLQPNPIRKFFSTLRPPVQGLSGQRRSPRGVTGGLPARPVCSRIGGFNAHRNQATDRWAGGSATTHPPPRRRWSPWARRGIKGQRQVIERDPDGIRGWLILASRRDTGHESSNPSGPPLAPPPRRRASWPSPGATRFRRPLGNKGIILLHFFLRSFPVRQSRASQRRRPGRFRCFVL